MLGGVFVKKWKKRMMAVLFVFAFFLQSLGGAIVYGFPLSSGMMEEEQVMLDAKILLENNSYAYWLNLDNIYRGYAEEEQAAATLVRLYQNDGTKNINNNDLLNAGRMEKEMIANPIVSVIQHGYDEGYQVEYSDTSKDCNAPVILLFINGNVISDADAIIKHDTIFVPLRAVGNHFGAAVNWDSSSKIAEITQNDINIKLTIGSKNMTVNGKNVEISHAPEIINSMTYVSLRAIAAALDAEVGFINNSKDIKLAYIHNKKDTICVTEEEAIQIAEDLYFNKFLPDMREYILQVWNVDINPITPYNVSSKLNRHYLGKCIADMGEYYYIQIFENEPDAILVDKYTGACYTVGAASLVFFDISPSDYFHLWGWRYQ